MGTSGISWDGFVGASVVSIGGILGPYGMAWLGTVEHSGVSWRVCVVRLGVSWRVCVVRLPDIAWHSTSDFGEPRSSGWHCDEGVDSREELQQKCFGEWWYIGTTRGSQVSQVYLASVIIALDYDYIKWDHLQQPICENVG